MEMNAAYVKAAKEKLLLEKHKIVHDRFHLTKLDTEAIAKQRRDKHRKLFKEGDHRLARSRYQMPCGHTASDRTTELWLGFVLTTRIRNSQIFDVQQNASGPLAP